MAGNNDQFDRLRRSLLEISAAMEIEWEKYRAANVDKNGKFLKITLTEEELDRLRQGLPSEIQLLIEQAEKEWDETRPKPR